MVWWIVEGYPEGIQFSNFPSTNRIPWSPLPHRFHRRRLNRRGNAAGDSEPRVKRDSPAFKRAVISPSTGKLFLFPCAIQVPWRSRVEMRDSMRREDNMEQEKCTSQGVVHCTSKNQINQEQLQEKCRREVGVMSSTILCCCPFLGLWMTL